MSDISISIEDEIIQDISITILDEATNESTIITVDNTIQENIIVEIGVPTENYMLDLIYDPQGKKTDVFNAENLTGNIDCGTFN